MLKEQISMALDSLRANKFRSLLTMLGIIIGAGTLVAVLSLGSALQGEVFRQFIDLGTRRIAVLPGDPSEPGARDVPGYGLLTGRDYAALERLVAAQPELYSKLAPQIQVPTEIRFGTTALQTTLVGTTADFPSVQVAPTGFGRFISAEDERSAARVGVLGRAIAESLFGSDEAALQAAVGQTVEINGQPMQVIGILAAANSIFGIENQVFAPVDTLRLRLVGDLDLPGRGPRMDQILVGLQSEQEVARAEELLTASLRQARGVPEGAIDDFEILSPTQPLTILAGINGAVTGFIAVVAAISLIVGGIGIMNIMLVAVTERTREIGVRKALGATDGDVLGQFVLEALTLSVVGSLIGISGAIVIVLLIGLASGIGASVSWVAVLIALLFSSLIGVGFGFYPARRAAMLQPIEALRYE
jgi:putative ABC transport system permease protein